LNVGPEVLTGSTRLKSGTACKMALNMLTTASMVRWGKVYDHWMVDLQPRSRKLVARSLRLVKELGQVSEEKAKELLKEAGGRVKPAILMARKNIYYKQAVQQLTEVGGFLRKAVDEWR
jgi:N-acetylmuramic acid 6-phosphate etherase